MVELIVSAAVIAVLLAMLVPAANSARQIALTARCASQMQNLWRATMLYAGDNQQQLPKPPPIQTDVGALKPRQYAWVMDAPGIANFQIGTLVKYIGPTPQVRSRMMMCPMDNGNETCWWKTIGADPTVGPHNFSYSYNAFLNVRYTDGPSLRLSKLRDSAGTILIWEQRAAYDGLVCFCGGPDMTWDKLAGWHQGKGNQVFSDGHIEQLQPRYVMEQSQYYWLTNDSSECGSHWDKVNSGQ